MQLARVIGNIVSTVKHPSHEGHKLMLIQPLSQNLEKKGNVMIAIDTVQSGEGDLVLLLSEGGSARQILNDHIESPIRAVIVGLVDSIDIHVSQ
ncbi:MAG: EutN/CcmL family microcompartment protein [Candidatus Sericytochromatia bacterium]|nr:EutN/CcmL family microcompartment protein [Candidatus Sericytochromatia bacterium]